MARPPLPDVTTPLATYHHATAVVTDLEPQYRSRRMGGVDFADVLGPLDAARRRRARALEVIYDLGYSYGAIAKMVGLSRQRVHEIIHGNHDGTKE
jgi:hypothetical protein